MTELCFSEPIYLPIYHLSPHSSKDIMPSGEYRARRAGGRDDGWCGHGRHCPSSPAGGRWWGQAPISEKHAPWLDTK